VFERRALPRRESGLPDRCRALLFRLFNTLWIDIAVHVGVKASLAAGSRAAKLAVAATPGFSIKGVRRLDDAERVLTLGHHYFRHEEMELFVPESRLAAALDVLRCATELFAGGGDALDGGTKAQLQAHGLYEELAHRRGTYVQHYPFFIRRLLPEDALVSMGSSASEPLYSVSVFTYSRPHGRDDYYAFCGWLARCMNALFGARLHWGKHFPLDAAQVAPLYPRLETFREVCRRTDPRGVFRNDYTARVLGLAPGPGGKEH
jgi:L-gulono-1,4-lactone dehydrogenase